MPWKSGYTICDEIDVKFPFQPSMDHHAVIRPDGMISTPGIGEIAAAGMTPPELEGLIIDKSKARLRDPEVTVILTKMGEQRVYVAGEVEKSNFVPLRPGMTPLQAVRFGCATAGISVTRPGTAPSMPSRAEVEALLAR